MPDMNIAQKHTVPENAPVPETNSTVRYAAKDSDALPAKAIWVIDAELRLVPYFPCYDVTLPWYLDPDVCKQVDNIDHVYSPDLLQSMYSFLDSHGDCYYIEYNGVLVGDITLRNNAEIAIVVSKEYQNRHIGRRCVSEMVKLAEEKRFPTVRANIYSFNTQSRKMFTSLGFTETEPEWFELSLAPADA